MEIYKAREMGFCYGVRRAMKLAMDTAASGKPAATLGPLIHNPQVVARLAAQGVPALSDLSEFHDKIVIIRRMVWGLRAIMISSAKIWPW